MLSSEQKAPIELSRNKELVISKPDKGNEVVLLDRKDYDRKMLEILNDEEKFTKLPDVDAYKDITAL